MSTTNSFPGPSADEKASEHRLIASSPDEHVNEEDEKMMLASLGLPEDFFATISSPLQIGDHVSSSATAPKNLGTINVPFEWISERPPGDTTRSDPFHTGLQFNTQEHTSQTNCVIVERQLNQPHPSMRYAKPSCFSAGIDTHPSIDLTGQNIRPLLQGFPLTQPPQARYDRVLQHPVRSFSTPQPTCGHSTSDAMSLEACTAECAAFDSINTWNLLPWDPQNSTRTNSTDLESPPCDVEAKMDTHAVLTKQHSFDLPFAASQLDDSPDQAALRPLRSMIPTNKRQRTIRPRLPTTAEYLSETRQLSFPVGLQCFTMPNSSDQIPDPASVPLPDLRKSASVGWVHGAIYDNIIHCGEQTICGDTHAQVSGSSNKVQATGCILPLPPPLSRATSPQKNLVLRRSASLSVEPTSNFYLTTDKPSPMDISSPQLLPPADPEISSDDKKSRSTGGSTAWDANFDAIQEKIKEAYKTADEIVDKAMRKKHIHKYSEMSRRERLKHAFRELQQAVPDAIPKGRRNLNRGVVLQEAIDYIKMMHEKKDTLLVERAAQLEKNRILRQRMKELEAAVLESMMSEFPSDSPALRTIASAPCIL